ncbi:MAG: helix-turn-helix transcriptional regulator [Clostridia bacterium]|nr:helix-turn-helix transcriptional regulator [Clostridia bacterium]
MDYRQRLRALREDHDLSQSEVGKMIHKSQQEYSHIENGRAELKIEDLAELCRYYSVSADYVIGLMKEQKPL